MSKLKNEILNRAAMNTIIDLHKAQLASEEVFVMDFTGEKPEIYTKKQETEMPAPEGKEWSITEKNGKLYWILIEKKVL